MIFYKKCVMILNKVYFGGRAIQPHLSGNSYRRTREDKVLPVILKLLVIPRQ